MRDSGKCRGWLAAATALGAALAGCGGNSSGNSGGDSSGSVAPESASIGHVFIMVMENKSYDRTFGSDSAAPYLAQTLPAQGALLQNYYATGHASLDNYIAMISGQAPNLSTQADCTFYHDVLMIGGLNGDGQALGQGCVYPSAVPSLPDQFKAAGIRWKGYMQDMGKDPTREAPACGHPALNSRDMTQAAAADDQYATRHNPFMYFHSIIDDQAYCEAHVVNMENNLAADLASIDTTPQYSFITPNLCDDGHDSSCADGEVGGLSGINRFLENWVPVVTGSPAFKKDGLLIILYDESAGSDTEDDTACCGEARSLLINTPLPPGETGPGGGRVGAVLLSPFIEGGTVSTRTYNHYAMLRTVEDIFGLEHLGYAAAGDATDAASCDASRQPCRFGADIFTAALPVFPGDQ